MALEIERKYLIRMPDVKMLEALPGVEIWKIVQTYLTDGENGESRRVRIVAQNGAETYFHTVKRHITNLTRAERECEISRAEYDRLLLDADPQGKPIHKTRYRVPYRDQLLEIDVYAFWQDRATLEIELQSEAQRIDLPEWVQIIRDVSAEKRYTNRQLARQIPMENIEPIHRRQRMEQK